MSERQPSIRYRLAFQKAMNKRGFVCVRWAMDRAQGDFVRPEHWDFSPGAKNLFVASALISAEIEGLADFDEVVGVIADQMANKYDRMLADGPHEVAA